jgi:hypothetical protein
LKEALVGTRTRLLSCVATAVAVAALAAPGFMLAGPASAATASAPPGWRVVQTDGAGTVSVPAYGDLSYAQWMAKYGNPLAAGNSPTSSSLISPDGAAASSLRIHSGGNTDHGRARVYGGTNYSQSNGMYIHSYFKKSSMEAWYTRGKRVKINASMHWWVSGVLITFSLPPGAGFYSDGPGILYKPGQVTAKAVYLNYPSTIQINSSVIYSADFTDEADMYIGNTWWHVQGN